MSELVHFILLPLSDFFERGGPTLYALLAVALLTSALILDRYWLYYGTFPAYLRELKAQWSQRTDRHSYRAHRIREGMISDIRLRLEANLTIIGTLVAMCPMIGLLGTVTGMIEVFDVMALKGTSDARAMAGGVSRATLPTMSGMVLAVPGLFFVTRCRYLARRRTAAISDELRFEK